MIVNLALPAALGVTWFLNEYSLDIINLDVKLLNLKMYTE